MDAGLGGDYSDYVKHRSNLITIFVLLCGFTFTATTILVTRLPESGGVASQLVLLFSAFLHDLFVFLLPSIFFLFDLTLLAIVSTLMWAFILVSGIIVIWRPFEQRRRKILMKESSS